MAWSADGTQLAAACANGHILFAHVVERHVHYMNFTTSVAERKIVTVKNVKDDTVEVLELPERVIQMAMRYSHLVVTTPTQCYIYNTTNWNTPAIFDLKDGSVILLLLCEKHMLLVEKSTVGLYNYQGRLIASPRWPNMRLDSLRTSQISLSPDTLVVRDAADTKSLHIIDLGSSRTTADSSTSIQHSIEISQLALDQWGPSSCRTLAVLDKNHNFYTVQVKSPYRTFSKLGRKIDSFQWNTNDNIIAAIQDTQLLVWYCPSASFNPDLLKLCSLQYDSPELGRSPRISDFVGNSVSIRRADGSLIFVPISPFPSMLHRYIQDGKWMDALNLCRSTKDKTLWACLAVLATQTTNPEVVDIAEESFANINQYDNVFYIQFIKDLPTKVQQKAAMALLGGQTQEAESILLHNGMVFQAIYNCIQLHNWRRALDLAIKHKTHIDTVLYMRQQYLNTLGKPENNNQFTSLKETVQIDEEKVQQKVQMELQKRKMSN